MPGFTSRGEGKLTLEVEFKLQIVNTTKNTNFQHTKAFIRHQRKTTLKINDSAGSGKLFYP